MDFHQASPPENGANEMKSGFIQQKIFIILKIKLNLDYHLQWPTKKINYLFQNIQIHQIGSHCLNKMKQSLIFFCKLES